MKTFSSSAASEHDSLASDRASSRRDAADRVDGPLDQLRLNFESRQLPSRPSSLLQFARFRRISDQDGIRHGKSAVGLRAAGTRTLSIQSGTERR